MEYVILAVVIFTAFWSLGLIRKSKTTLPIEKKKSLLFWSKILLLPLITSVMLVLYMLYLGSQGKLTW